MGLPAPKRRRLHPPPRSSASDAVITFDTTARHDYLTGFHKRKQARIQHAREIAARRAKDERLRERKEMRERRRQDLDRHVREFNAELRKQNLDLDQDHDEDDEDELPGWEGTATNDETNADEEADERTGEEDEYVDEEKYTTVTVSAMTFSDDNDEEGTPSPTAGQNAGNDVSSQRRNLPGPEHQREKRTKKKKKTFRYESKAERLATRLEQKRKSRAARARREKDGGRGR